MPSLTLNWLNKAHSRQLAYEPNYPLLKRVCTHVAAGADSASAAALAASLPDSPAYRDNWLIQGDNLQALKALLPFYRGQVKCIFIDPPYNTGSAFEHYNDKLEHTQWLHMMYPRLILLRELLADDGSIWVTLDDNEAHYAKVLMDEVFGRQNFVANVVWQKRTSPDARLRIGDAHDHVMLFCKNIQHANFNLLGLTAEQKERYKNPDNDLKGAWVSSDYSAQGYRPNQMYTITSPAGVLHSPPIGSCWKNTEDKFLQLLSEGRMWFGKDGKGVPRKKNYLDENIGRTAWTWWSNSEVGHNQEAKKEINELFGNADAFATPKPERLLQRVLQLATNPNDLVLDSFLGSGTTAAVAHKMGRRWIGIEMGEHALTHCQPRLQKVLAGEQGGISAAVGWQGGGAFSTYTLGAQVFLPSGKIDPAVRFADLAAYVWQQETRLPATQNFTTPCLGVCELKTPETTDSQSTSISKTAYYLLYNGILGDKRPAGGNVLTYDVLAALQACYPFTAADGLRVVFGEACKVSPTALARANMVFKKIPYSLRTGKMI